MGELYTKPKGVMIAEQDETQEISGNGAATSSTGVHFISSQLDTSMTYGFVSVVT